MSTEPTLLILAFEFPPVGSIGAQRSLKLAKYLPEHGVKPVVVTADLPSLAAWGYPPENDYQAELSRDTVIHRVPCPRPRQLQTNRWVNWLRYFFMRGDDIGRQWKPHMAKVWAQLVAKHEPAAVYVSIPPFGVAPLAVELARRVRLPLIIDFRDHWSQWCSGPKTSWLHYRIQLYRERACLEGAQTVVGVTGQLIFDLQAAHPQVAREKFHVIPNGYDASLSVPAPSRSAARGPKPFVIGYVGSFYYSPQARASVMEPWWRRSPHRWMHYSPRREDWLYRSPYFFFQALRRLLADRPELRPLVKVRFAGTAEEWLLQQVADFGLQDVVEHLGRLTHDASMKFQADCDALLATSAKVIGGRDYCIAGKTFEYVATRRPILAFVTAGEQREFLIGSGMALICDPDDTAAAARNLEALVEGRFMPDLNLPFLRRFHRRETSRQMAELLHKTIGQPGCRA